MSARPNPVNLFFIVSAILIGLIFAAFGYVTAWSTWSASANETRIEGTVVDQARPDVPKGKGSGSKPGFAPIVEYRVNDRLFRIQGRVASSSPAYAVGDKVNVLVPADNPADGQIDSFVEKWLVSIVFGGVGTLVTLIGGGMLIAHFWRRPRA